MKRNRIMIWLLLAFVLLLSGCSMRTIDELYCLPKRSEDYLNLLKERLRKFAGRWPLIFLRATKPDIL